VSWSARRRSTNSGRASEIVASARESRSALRSPAARRWTHVLGRSRSLGLVTGIAEPSRANGGLWLREARLQGASASRSIRREPRGEPRGSARPRSADFSGGLGLAQRLQPLRSVPWAERGSESERRMRLCFFGRRRFICDGVAFDIPLEGRGVRDCSRSVSPLLLIPLPDLVEDCSCGRQQKHASKPSPHVVLSSPLDGSGLPRPTHPAALQPAPKSSSYRRIPAES
jgi:hypothetical protein